MRQIYTIAFYIALPFIFLRAAWRARNAKPHLRRLGERLGFYPGQKESASIWLHAVSYGEAVAAEPLLKKIKITYPNLPIVITTMTLSGAIRVSSTWKQDGQIRHFYFPYDIPFAIKQFLRHMKPQIGIIMETELWPNLLHIANQHKLPLLLANARLSPRSLIGYKKISSFISPLLKSFTYIAAQSDHDAKRFIELGATKQQTVVLGNLKFDIQPPIDQINQSKELRQQLPFDYVLVAASTHANEEEQLLDLFSTLQQKFERLLLVLVPRHPERFDEIASLCAKKGHQVARRSAKEIPRDHTVYLGDTMGEMYFYYGLADVAFVGGSLVPVGGHNLLEPAALKLPIVTGPHLFNFTVISQLLIKTNTLHVAKDANDLYTIIFKLFTNQAYCHEVGQAGFSILADNQGAADRHLAVIKQISVSPHGNESMGGRLETAIE